MVWYCLWGLIFFVAPGYAHESQTLYSLALNKCAQRLCALLLTPQCPEQRLEIINQWNKRCGILMGLNLSKKDLPKQTILECFEKKYYARLEKAQEFDGILYAITADGKQIVYEQNHKIIVSSVRTPLSRDIGFFGYCPTVLEHNNRLIATGPYQSIIVYDLLSGEKKIHDISINRPINYHVIQLVRGGSQVISCLTPPNYLTVRDIETGKCLDELPCPQEQLYDDIWLLVVSCDGTKVLAGTHSNVLVWDLPTREFRYSVAAQEHNYHNPFVVTSDSRYLISVLPSHQIGISNVQDGSYTNILPGHEEPVDFLLLSSTDSTLVSSSRDKTIKVWDLATSRLLHQIKRRGDFGNRISLVMGDRMIADVSEEEGILSLWDLHSGAFLQEISGIKFPTYRNFSFINTKEYAAYANMLLKRESWQSIINRMPTKKEKKRFSFFK